MPQEIPIGWAQFSPQPHKVQPPWSELMVSGSLSDPGRFPHPHLGGTTESIVRTKNLDLDSTLKAWSMALY